jgi:hypothetical protein
VPSGKRSVSGAVGTTCGITDRAYQGKKMPDTYSASFRKSGGYTFDRETIIDLFNITRRFVEKDLTVDVLLEGDHSIESTDIESVLNDLYVKNKLIEGISITGYNFDSNPQRLTQIRLGMGWNAVSVRISGEKDQSTNARTELENVIDGRADWYSKLIRKPILLTAIIAGIIAAGIYATHSRYNANPFGTVISGISFVVEIGVAWFIMLFLLDRMFPSLTFSIGRSSSQVESARVWRTVVFVGIILSLMVGVAAGFIVEFIK